jgi:hypothetical protein
MDTFSFQKLSQTRPKVVTGAWDREVVKVAAGERGMIFSDGIEADFLDFNSGSKADVQVADRVGRLVV